jgi:hypothetical protein
MMWKNERIDKLEKRVADLETQIHGMIWFRDEIIDIVKEFVETRNIIVTEKEKPK